MEGMSGTNDPIPQLGPCKVSQLVKSGDRKQKGQEEKERWKGKKNVNRSGGACQPS